MAKALENQYRLENGARHLTPEEVTLLLNDFEYFMANFQQIVDKSGRTVPFKLNAAQKFLFKKLLPMILPQTRLERKHTVVVTKVRQMGASTGLVAFINYLCAYVEGLNNLNIVHTFPIGDAGGKFYNEKVLPIITGVHPDVMPKIERTFTSNTSKVITYHSIKSFRRNNSYEIISANASSIRGSTNQVWIADEVSDYSKPYDLEAAMNPSLPDYGFSLIVYLSTFSDKRSDYFLEKIKLAQEEPEDYTLLFIPWYVIYPEVKYGVKLENLELTDYDNEIILPALQKDGVPVEEWGDCIDWYHRKKKEFRNNEIRMKQEHPTTIEEILKMGANEKVFNKEDLIKQEANLLPEAHYQLSTDVLTNKVDMRKSDAGPLLIYRPPEMRQHYLLAVDPITSVSDDSDYFAASMFNTRNNEQVAVLHGRGLLLEDWAVMCVALARMYNQAVICPESNVGEGFKIKAWDMGYYNWFYVNAQARKNRTPGLRTTATSKVDMVEKLQHLLFNGGIIIHDAATLEELANYERQVRQSSSGESVVRMTAPKGKHDDLVSACFIYAGTLDQHQLSAKKTRGWSLI